jgi:Protein of unknown function (DUF2845)
VKTICILATLLLTATAAQAETTMRCDNGILSVGDSKYDALTKCGEPAMKDSFPQPVGTGSATVTIDEWMYDFGPTRFVYKVRIEGGKVVRIESTNNAGSSR